jgi:hypothetical protein
MDFKKPHGYEISIDKHYQIYDNVNMGNTKMLIINRILVPKVKYVGCKPLLKVKRHSSYYSCSINTINIKRNYVE